jgi:hypothetical protein
MRKKLNYYVKQGVLDEANCFSAGVYEELICYSIMFCKATPSYLTTVGSSNISKYRKTKIILLHILLFVILKKGN